MVGGSPLNRAVEVLNPHAEKYGSGTIVAPGLVLSAYHVASPHGDDRGLRLRTLVDGMEAEGTVVWGSEDLDVVLVSCDPALVGRDLHPVRWGRLVCEDPRSRRNCTVTGFPQGMRRTGAHGALVDDPMTVYGEITPGSVHRSGLYTFALSRAAPASPEHWQGLSGAALFCDTLLVGVVCTAAAGWGAEVLMARPAYQLLEVPGFISEVMKACGMAPYLRPAELDDVLLDVPNPRLSASYLLDPRSRVVPLSGMSDALDSLEGWCRTDWAIDATIVGGIGGVGKSRLADELGYRLGQRPDAERLPWVAGFLSEVPRGDSAHLRTLASCNHPLLLVVDYSEARWEQLTQLMEALTAARFGGRVRLLLLARTTGGWWGRLSDEWWQRTASTRRADSFGQPRCATPSDALPDGEQAMLVRATDAFVTRIDILLRARAGELSTLQHEPTGQPTAPEYIPGSTPTTVMELQIMALAAALRLRFPDLTDAENPLRVVLAHEEKYWRLMAAHRIPVESFDLALMRELVAGQRLAGAVTAEEAEAVVKECINEHHHDIRGARPSADLVPAWERILQDLYPSNSGAWWGGIGPDILSTEVTAEADDASGNRFVKSLLCSPNLTSRQREQALTQIARAAHTHPQLAQSAAHSVVEAPGLLLKTATERLPTQLARDAEVAFLQHLGAVARAMPDAGTFLGRMNAEKIRRTIEATLLQRRIPPIPPSAGEGPNRPGPEGPYRPGPEHRPGPGFPGTSRARGPKRPGPRSPSGQTLDLPTPDHPRKGPSGPGLPGF